MDSLVFYRIYRIYLFIKKFPRNLVYSTKWFFRMWNNGNYIPEDAMKMLSWKYDDMIKYLNKHSYLFVKRLSYIRALKIAKYYLDKLLSDNICENLYEQFFEKYGGIDIKFEDYGNSSKMNIYFKKCDTDKKQDYADKVLKRIRKIQTDKMNKYRKMFLKAFNRYFDKWGDF